MRNPNYFFFYFLHSAFSTLLIFRSPQFPHPFLPSRRPSGLGGKKMFLLPCPHYSGKSSISCYSYCGLWSSGININGSFSSNNCWLHLGRIELSEIPANIWFSRKRVPTRITDCSENQLFSSPQIFRSKCDLRYLFCLFSSCAWLTDSFTN